MGLQNACSRALYLEHTKGVLKAYLVLENGIPAIFEKYKNIDVSFDQIDAF
jgi:hypothetical protein